jgi:hypothetical protein
MEYADGGVYVGEWRDDLRHGNGSQTFALGDVYEGGWGSDAMNGRGSLWFADGRRYVGDMVDGLPSGGGVMVDQRTANAYAGALSVGEFDGFGILHYGEITDC